jgi:hypothetical protein
MIWRNTATNHNAAIGTFARQWLGGTMWDRLIMVSIAGGVWFVLLMFVALFAHSPGVILLCFLASFAPWAFWLIDAKLEANYVAADVATFSKEGAILATRCEYLGGHPQLPHGRFAYLTLEGTKQSPNLSLVFPGTNPERFHLPLLDLTRTKPEKGSDASLAADLATAIHKDAGGLLRPQRLTLVVDYDGAAGRKHKVELTNFFHGNDEIRNWRNYLVCAQAEADTGVRPHEPWKDLPDGPAKTEESEIPHAFSRNGHTEEQPSSAFGRR